ncbi:MAG: CopD family protein [Chloroflexota bacterium]
MQTPQWALLISFWLHMLATVIWLGALSSLAIIVLPLAKKQLSSDAFSDLLRNVNKKLDPLGWLSLGILTATGLVQMSANPSYEGLFAFNNNWALALLVKHILFLGMIAVSAYLTWTVNPAIERAAILRAKNPGKQPTGDHDNRLIALLRLNLVLAAFVLVLTALARIS